MMSLCKKNVHSFLSHSTRTSAYPCHHHGCHFPSTTGCFGLLAGETQNPPNIFVLESSAIKPTLTTSACNKDSTNFKLYDSAYNGSCTESLGFESSDYPIEESLEEEELLRSRSMAARSRWKSNIVKARTQETKFPPPLPSLNQNGKPRFYLKPLRRNGRLELTEVRVERPEIFKAFRQDGRLRLQLVRSEPQIPSPAYEDCDQVEEQESLPLPRQQEEEEEIIENQEVEEEEEEEITEKQEEEAEEIIGKQKEEEEDEEEEITEKQEEEVEEILGKQKEEEITEKQEEELEEIIEKQKEEEEDEEISEEEKEEEDRRLKQWNLEGVRWRCQEVNNHRPHHLLYGATIV